MLGLAGRRRRVRPASARRPSLRGVVGKPATCYALRSQAGDVARREAGSPPPAHEEVFGGEDYS